MDQGHMTALLALIHKMIGHLAIVMVGAGVFAAIDFSRTITLGSVLLGIIVLVVAAMFTIRSKIATIWREEAEGERARVARLEEQIAEEKEDRANFELAQQEIRHDLKDELAACKAQLKAMEARTDLTVALREIREMNENTVTKIGQLVVDTFVEKSKQEHAETHKLLSEIRDKLPSEPIAISVQDDGVDAHLRKL
jgi:hypothetical protein